MEIQIKDKYVTLGGEVSSNAVVMAETSHFTDVINGIIKVPENLFNRVTYTYGKAGDKYNRAGRLALVEDASGGEAYYYGRQGEVTKTVRTVMASVADIRTYVYGATYDSWNRVQTMTYPDGEVVTYHYNAAGQVESLTSNKQGRQSVIVDRIGYDKEGHTVYTKLGNGTETTYTYDLLDII